MFYLLIVLWSMGSSRFSSRTIANCFLKNYYLLTSYYAWMLSFIVTISFENKQLSIDVRKWNISALESAEKGMITHFKVTYYTNNSNWHHIILSILLSIRINNLTKDWRMKTNYRLSNSNKSTSTVTSNFFIQWIWSMRNANQTPNMPQIQRINRKIFRNENVTVDGFQ